MCILYIKVKTLLNLDTSRLPSVRRYLFKGALKEFRMMWLEEDLILQAVSCEVSLKSDLGCERLFVTRLLSQWCMVILMYDLIFTQHCTWKHSPHQIQKQNWHCDLEVKEYSEVLMTASLDKPCLTFLKAVILCNHSAIMSINVTNYSVFWSVTLLAASVFLHESHLSHTLYSLLHQSLFCLLAMLILKTWNVRLQMSAAE